VGGVPEACLVASIGQALRQAQHLVHDLSQARVPSLDSTQHGTSVGSGFPGVQPACVHCAVTSIRAQDVRSGNFARRYEYCEWA
jgi:hypothetical protein